MKLLLIFHQNWIGCAAATALLISSHVRAAERPDIGEQLESGHLAAANDSLAKYLTQQPADDLVRFQLGTVQFFAAVERLAQDSYKYGLHPPSGAVMFLRTPTKYNPHPSPITYRDARAMIQRFVDSVNKAQATLEPIKDKQLTWKLNLAAVRIDMNGDGTADADETLSSLLRTFANRHAPANEVSASFLVGFDSADVHWLRGYCHLLAALGEMILAYDQERLFERTAQLFFADPQTKFATLLVDKHDNNQQGMFSRDSIMDAIAFIHLINFPLHEPERLKTAQHHLLAMIAASRTSWQLIEAETDNDHEWIPGPGQESILPNVTINGERRAAWRRFLDEAEDVLNGKKLIPFWRDGTDKGLNLAKAFTEPKDFDLVLWVQGTDAVPYLEDGDKSSVETWREFQRVFEGNFVGMAILIN